MTNKKMWIVAGVGLAILVCVAFWARSQSVNEHVEKNVVNNYVCQIVDYDNESQMIAVRCLTK